MQAFRFQQSYNSQHNLLKMPLGGLCDKEQAKAIARRLMDNYDRDMDGIIGHHECVNMIVDAYRSFNRYFNPSKGDISSYQRVLDRDRNGKINYEDVEQACIRYLCTGDQVQKSEVRTEINKRNNRRQLTQIANEKLDVARRIFKELDKDNSGYLEEIEIPEVLRRTYQIIGLQNYIPSRQDISSWLKMSDSNRDGKVSLEEFEELVIESLKKAGIQVEEGQISLSTNLYKTTNSQYQQRNSYSQYNQTSYNEVTRQYQSTSQYGVANQSYSPSQQRGSQILSPEKQGSQPYSPGRQGSQPYSPGRQGSQTYSPGRYGGVSFSNVSNLKEETAKKHQKGLTLQAYEKVEAAKRIFRQMDKDFSGYLEEREVPALLIQTYKITGVNNFQPTQDDIISWIKMGDQNMDGKVSLEEFEILVLESLRKAGIQIEDGRVKIGQRTEQIKRNTFRKQQLPLQVKEKLDVAKRIFRQLDKDHSGYLEEREISSLLIQTYDIIGKRGYEPTYEDIQGWLKMSDRDFDGKVSLDEYEELVLSSLKKAGFTIEQGKIKI